MPNISDLLLSKKEQRRKSEATKRIRFMRRAGREWRFIFSVIEPKDGGFENFAGRERDRVRVYEPNKVHIEKGTHHHGVQTHASSKFSAPYCTD